MRKLKCEDCGASLKIETSADGHILGHCRHCQSEYLLKLQGRQHVILEHRYPNGRPEAVARPLPARRLFIGGAVALGAASMLPLLPSLFRKAAPKAEVPADLIFNIGGEGATPGQFRDQVFHIGIDSLSRAVLTDNRNRFYVFGPEGNFIASYTQPDGVSRKYCGLLPSGDLVFASLDEFAKLDLETGEIKEKVAVKSGNISWGSSGCVTAQGGLAIFSTKDGWPSRQGGNMPDDEVIFFDANLRETHRLTNLLRQAIADDPMVSDGPVPTSIQVDTAGSLFINVRASEDHDARGGIFEFNAQGVFQRRIALEQAWHGEIALAADGSIWYGDPWMNELQHITNQGITRLPLSGLAAKYTEALGNLAALAIYPNGDLAVTTMNHRFARLRVKTQRT